ncbi:hypothetical protein RDV89_06635 [Nocardioides zeae]|uniref:Htaa domain-containing protein n=1 Tax=Nocardioides imazamoxiresistens TaxID=3231893 RepID=A0ABU3PU34_9ACTN|nr:hypothetical protein [Nocardioides zeae]MDT9592735.1 hypothetical protein [Nocardioides zeae]
MNAVRPSRATLARLTAPARPALAVLAVVALVAALALAVLAVRPAPAHGAEPVAGETAPTEEPTAAPTEEPTEEPTAGPTQTPTEQPAEEPEPTDEPGGAVQVDDAVFRWGMNAESSKPTFFGHNFFAAGIVELAAGRQVQQRDWRAQDGDVTVERAAGTGWETATWPAGQAWPGGPQQVRLGGGTGEVDVAAGTATIAWEGDYSVLYYTGLSVFHVSDPVLSVEGGRGQVRATVTGYEGSQDDPDQRGDQVSGEVVIADLPRVELSEAGFSATPSYAGVRVEGLSTPQVRDAGFGAFPQGFVSLLDPMGIAAFWYTTGSSVDQDKPASPLAVSFDASRPVVVPPSPVPTQPGDGGDVPDNVALPPPARTPAAGPAGSSGSGGARAPAAVAPNAPSAPLAPGVPVAALAVDGSLPAAADLQSAAYASAVTDPAARAASVWWWVGGVLLLAAAALLSLPAGRPPLPRRPGGTPR